MKKRILSLALALVMCLGLSVPALAEHAASDVAYPVTDGNIYFDPATGTITDADYEVTAAQIPAQINGVAVTSIGDEAFINCYGLNSVTIPGSVKSIGSGAFVFTVVEELTILEGVVSIGESAFYGTGLTSVTFPASLTSIGAGAFMSSALTSATFLNGNTEIGAAAFNFESFEYVDDEGNQGYGGNVPLEGLTIYAPAGGKVEQYCKDNGITFQAINGEPQPLAYASTQNVLVDGKPVEFQCYALKDANGYDTNYIKVRDLAYVLNGTAAQFNVGWDGSVNLEKGKAYVSNGSEMKTPFSGNRAYQASAAETKVDGAVVKLESIVLNDDNGGGYTYYKLRDLGAALGFKVDWSAEKGVYIETK